MEKSLTCCPICNKAYKKVGCHLRYYPERDGGDYSIYTCPRKLKNIPNKSTPCPTCGKMFTRLDVHLRTSATCKQQLDGPIAPIQPESDSCPPSSEVQSLQAMQYQSSCSQSTITSVSPCPKPLPPFKTPKCSEQWEEVDSELPHCLVPVVISAMSPDEKHSILYQGVYDYMFARFDTRRVTHNQKKRRGVSEGDSPTIPCFNQESAESFFTEVYDSCPRYTRPAWLPQPSPVTMPFNEEPILQREVEEVIRC